MVFGEVGETLELVIVIAVMCLGLYLVYLIQQRTSR